MLELRQLSLRQEALSQQLEQENTELRDSVDELRGYVQQLVAENESLAEDLRSEGRLKRQVDERAGEEKGLTR